MIADRSRYDHGIALADIVTGDLQAVLQHADAGGDDEDGIGLASLDHLGIAGDDRHAGLTCSGRHRAHHALQIGGDRIREGDAVIVSGSIGDHGIAILSKRENLDFETAIESDSAPLHRLIAAMIAAEPDIHCLRDPTRGGLAATLNELANQAGIGMVIDADALPIKPAVRGACELLGIDPLGVANEGKLLAFCPRDRADALVAVMRRQEFGQDAAVIGHVQPDPRRLVRLRTSFGSERVLEWLNGEQLPRIC